MHPVPDGGSELRPTTWEIDLDRRVGYAISIRPVPKEGLRITRHRVVCYTVV